MLWQSCSRYRTRVAEDKDVFLAVSIVCESCPCANVVQDQAERIEKSGAVEAFDFWSICIRGQLQCK